MQEKGWGNRNKSFVVLEHSKSSVDVSTVAPNGECDVRSLNTYNIEFCNI